MTSGETSTANAQTWEAILKDSREPWRQFVQNSHHPSPGIRRLAVSDAWEETTRVLGTKVPAYATNKEQFLAYLLEKKEFHFSRGEASRIRFAHYMRTVATHDALEISAGTAFAAVSILAAAAERIDGVRQGVVKPDELIAQHRFGIAFFDPSESSVLSARVESDAWANFLSKHSLTAGGLRKTAEYLSISKAWLENSPRMNRNEVDFRPESIQLLEGELTARLGEIEARWNGIDTATESLASRQIVEDIRSGVLAPIPTLIDRHFDAASGAASSKKAFHISRFVVALLFSVAIVPASIIHGNVLVMTIASLNCMACVYLTYFPMNYSLGGVERLKFALDRRKIIKKGR